jgi:phosphomannomutase/phosphoglucomutase
MAGPVSGRRIKRRTIRNITIVAAITIVVLAILAAIYHLSVLRTEKTKQVNLAEFETTINQMTEIVARPLKQIAVKVDNLINEHDLAGLFTAADMNALSSHAEILKEKIPSALKARLFFPGKYQLDQDSKPPLGYASLDLLKQAEQPGKPIGAEVHAFGNPDAHVVLVRRITDDTGDLLGLLHVSIEVMPLIKLDEATNGVDGYVELVQEIGGRQLLLNKAGNARYRQGNPVVTQEVPGTRWRINYWVPVIVAVDNPQNAATNYFYIIIVLSALVIIAIVLVIRGRRPGVIHPEHDQDNREVVYAGAVKAIMDGLHPGLEKLMPGSSSKTEPDLSHQKISRGLTGSDDITAFARPPVNVPVAGNKNIKVPAVNHAKPGMHKKPGPDAAAKPVVNAQPEPEPTTKTTTAQSVAPEPSNNISSEIFRTYDIRGVVGKTLTVHAVQEIGRAIGSEAKARNQAGIVTGRDGRTSSQELADALITGLRASGCDVIDIGLVATPMLYFATFQLETGNGVMVTGSHNGPEYNGLKIVIDNETLSGEAIQSIRKRIESGDMNSGQGGLQSADITADYLRRVTEDIPVALGGAFKVVIDCGNGAAGGIAPQVYRAMGHDVIELFCEIDGRFPNHHPDPSQPGNLQALITRVKETQSDIGFAFDGDGDRLGVIDGEGNIIWPDRQMMLFARDVLSRNAGAPIIYDVKCSRYLKSIIEKSGGKPMMWKTGHSLIKGKMKEINAPLAGEMSGHIFFKERWYGFDDAIYAGARMLEILTKSKARPADVFADLPGGLSTHELRISLPEKYHARFMQALKKKMSFQGAEITDIDGIRVDFPEGWGLIRPSNTSPCLIARFEAEDKNSLEKIQKDFRDLIHMVTPDLKLPF